jgi:DNA-binding NarL/FixJ family response regulator
MSQPKSASKIRRVAIVEDDTRLRERLERILKAATGISCVGTFGSGEKALAAMKILQPDVILMDINLPGISGIECVAQLRKDMEDVHVIMLTIYEDSDRIFQALQAGADGYLVKSSPTDVLLRAIEEVHQGGAPMSSHIAQKVVRHFRQVGQSRDEAVNLAPREREVLNLLAAGFVYKEIADQLGIGSETVRTYVKNSCKKLHVRNRLEAVARFVKK